MIVLKDNKWVERLGKRLGKIHQNFKYIQSDTLSLNLGVSETYNCTALHSKLFNMGHIV